MTIAPTSGFREAKFIVSRTAGFGNYTTIAAAISAASAGDTIFVRTGSYTENLSLKSGVNITAWSGDDNEDNVEIIGKATYSSAGTVNISNIRLTTNSDYFLEVTGSAASIVNIEGCFLNCLNNTGIHFTSSNVAATITFNDCSGDLVTTGIGLFTCTSAGTLDFYYCYFSNTGSSTTTSTHSGNSLRWFWSYTQSAIAISGSGTNNSFQESIFDTSLINTTSVSVTGTTGLLCQFSYLASGTASAISIGAGCTGSIASNVISSANANVITGSGTLNHGGTVFIGGSSTINSTLTVVGLPYLVSEGGTAASSFNINGSVISGTSSTAPLTAITLANQKFLVGNTSAAPTAKSFSVVNQVFTGSGTYTPTSGMIYCSIRCVGGGGGGGGTATASATTGTHGGGGGGGGYSEIVSSAATIGSSQTVTIGGGGSGGASGNHNGNAGSDTSVGAICIGKGGSGGQGNDGASATSGGAGGVAGTGDYTVPGQGGGYTRDQQGMYVEGQGGNSLLGMGGVATSNAGLTNQTGIAGSNYGGGGSGGASYNGGGAAAGGNGAGGIVIIQEYILS